MERKHYKDFNETVYKKTLPNGLKVVMVPKNDFNKTFITFGTNYGGADLSFIPRGMKNVKKQPAGIAHFLEHKLFKMPDGTDAFEKLDSLGIESNAFTSFDKTVYLIGGTNNMNEGLEFLLDFVQTPYFTTKNIKKEQGIIEEEINMYLDEPSSKMFNKLLENTYKNNNLKEEILGTVKSIYEINKADLYLAHETFYHPSNMRVIITGNFNPIEVIKIIEDNQAKKNYKKEEEIKSIKTYEPKKVNIKEDFDEANITTPLVGLSIKFSDNNNLKEQYIKAVKLGMLLEYYFSNSGEVYDKLLKDELINNTFSYSLNLYKESLSFMISSYTNKPVELVNYLRKTLINLKRRDFNEERFSLIKRSSYGSFIRSLNRVEGINYGYLEILPYELDLFDIPEIIDNLDYKDVFSLTKEINSNVITSYTLNPKKKF